jgi:predicted permease
VLDVSPNLRVFAFTAAVSIGTGVLFGVAAAVRAGRGNLAPALKISAGSNRLHSAVGPRKILAVTQVSLSLILLIGAGLFVRSFRNLNSQDAGFPRDHLLLVRIEPKGSDQRSTAGTLQRLDRIYTELIDRVKGIPGVRSATLANVSPTKPESGCCSLRDPQTGQITSLPMVMVYPDYFATLDIPLVAGRTFEAADFREKSPEVAVVNETFARMRFPGEDPIGKRANRATIIGVVKDSRYTTLRGPTQPTYYMPFLTASTGRGQMILQVRTSIDSDSIRARVREEVWNADPTVPQFETYSLAEEVDAVLVQDRLIATLSSLLGGLALVLASIGLYGLIAFGVVQRTGEMALRMALGAMRWDVVRMILLEALLLVLIGVAIGIPAAVGLARIASSQVAGLLFGLTASDPLTIAVATVLLVAVAAIAAYLPARRASRVDPMIALRNE